MHKHKHNCCEHCLHHCPHCDRVYCCKCDKEWGSHSYNYNPNYWIGTPTLTHNRSGFSTTTSSGAGCKHEH